MSQVKLDLQNKNVAEKIQKSRSVLTALGTPPPAPYAALAGELLAATDTLEADNQAADTADNAVTNAHAKLNASEAVFNKAFAALGGQVQITTKGEAAAITATNFDVRSEASPVTSLDGVQGFTVTTTNLAGTLDFAWDKSKGAVNYELRGRKQSDPAGAYSFSKTTTKTRLRMDGFDSGVPYTFEIRAHGPGELESDWSNPFTKIAS
jgi:hypothetical protein